MLKEFKQSIKKKRNTKDNYIKTLERENVLLKEKVIDLQNEVITLLEDKKKLKEQKKEMAKEYERLYQQNNTKQLKRSKTTKVSNS